MVALLAPEERHLGPRLNGKYRVVFSTTQLVLGVRNPH